MVIQKKQLLLKLFWAYYVLLVALYVIGVPLFTLLPQNFNDLLAIGGKFGTLSVFFYALTLLPGILKRLQIFPVTQVTLMLFRRQFGISMFLLAINHSGYSLLFPSIALTGVLPTVFSFREILGTLAEIVLFPLFITSNDLSVRRLGAWWNTVHKLTYVAIVFIFGHIVLLGGELGIKLFVASLLIAEVVSWIAVWRRPTVVPVLAPQV